MEESLEVLVCVVVDLVDQVLVQHY
jgi:hypothetical protein